MATSHQLTEWALNLAEHGWHVFPITPGAKKPPVVRDWEHRATTDPTRIRRCWNTGPFNIGIATGPSGLVVVDLDTARGSNESDGDDALAALCADRGVHMPATYTVTTPSGGTHLYFATPAGVRLRNTSDQLGMHIDTRAEGGYVVAAGSITPAGGYDLTDDSPPVELPGWLVQALSEQSPAGITGRDERPVTRLDRYTTTAVERECARVTAATSGQHNRILANAAYNLGQLVGAGMLTDADAAGNLTRAAAHMITSDCDCTPAEVARVIRAGLAAGARRPRRTGRTEAA